MKKSNIIISLILASIGLASSGCKTNDRSLGVLTILNDYGEKIFVETNLKSADGGSQTNISITNNGSVDLCKSAVEDGTVKSMDLGEICTNFTDGYVTLYKYDTSGNKIKCREWTYAERNNTGRQFFNSEYLKYSSGASAEWNVEETIYQYLFTILPEDLE